MLGDSIKKFALSQAFSYIEKDPIKNLTHVMDMVDKFAGDGPQSFPRQRQAIRDAINNEDSTAHKLVLRMMTEMDLGFTETLLSNLFLNASITGWKKQDEYRTKYNCNVPWAILLDPTSACNLHCKGRCRRAGRRAPGRSPCRWSAPRPPPPRRTPGAGRPRTPPRCNCSCSPAPPWAGPHSRRRRCRPSPSRRNSG